MKKLFGLVCALFCGAAFAADITIYYSPTCPHCHHARKFISNDLVYEYPDLKVTTVNVMQEGNRPEFMDTLKKCEYTSGGVPVLVIGEKCFQGYGDSMADELRAAIEVDLTDEAKKVAADNKAEKSKDAAAFRSAHADRAAAIVEREPVAVEPKVKVADDQPAQKKIKKSDDSWVFYVILIALFVGLALVLRKGNKK